VTPESDIAEPMAEIARRQGELLVAIEDRARAERALKLLMFDSVSDPAWDVPLRPADAPTPIAARADVKDALKTAAASRPELADADARIALQDIEIAAARDRLKPQLDLVGSYTTRGLAGTRHEDVYAIPGLPLTLPDELDGALGASLESTLRNRFPDVTVGVQFTLPLGQRAARADVATSESAKRQALSARERLLLQIGVEVRNAVTAVDTAAERIGVARAAREAAEVQLQAEQDRFAAGLTTTFLVLTRQNDLVTARETEATARATYRRALVELSRAKGTLLAERGVEMTSNR
jgi:HAE1 family hydrophobic/amphiphilic exporter-1